MLQTKHDQCSGRVKLEDEAFDIRVTTLDLERLSESIAWIDLSFVERQRTPEWAIQIGIRCHLTSMSLRDASRVLEKLGANGVMSPSTSGFTRPSYSRCPQSLRINSRLTRR
jgi:hypothetical protein